MVIGDEHKDIHEWSRRRDCDAGATPQGNRVPPQVQVIANDQVLVNPLAMTDGEVRASLFQIS